MRSLVVHIIEAKSLPFDNFNGDECSCYASLNFNGQTHTTKALDAKSRPYFDEQICFIFQELTFGEPLCVSLFKRPVASYPRQALHEVPVEIGHVSVRIDPLSIESMSQGASCFPLLTDTADFVGEIVMKLRLEGMDASQGNQNESLARFGMLSLKTMKTSTLVLVGSVVLTAISLFVMAYFVLHGSGTYHSISTENGRWKSEPPVTKFPVHVEDLAMEYSSIALALLQNNRPMEAIALLTTKVDLNPSCFEAWLLLGMAHSKAGEQRAAMRCCEKAAELNPTSVRAATCIGNSAYSLGFMERALESFKNISLMDSHNLENLDRLSAVLLEIGEIPEAKAILMDAVSKGASSYSIFYNIGYCHAKLNETQAAFKAFQRAVQLNPKSVEGLTNFGVQAFQSGAYDAALQSFSAIISMNSTGSPRGIEKIHMYLGATYEKLGENALALSAYQNSLNYSPDTETLLLLGRLQFKMGLSMEALETLEYASLLDPLNFNVQFNKGLVYEAIGENTLGLSSFLKANELKPTHQRVYVYIGVLQYRLGRFEDAIEALSHAIKMNKYDRHAYQLLRLMLKAQEGEFLSDELEKLSFKAYDGSSTTSSTHFLIDEAVQQTSLTVDIMKVPSETLALSPMEETVTGTNADAMSAEKLRSNSNSAASTSSVYADDLERQSDAMSAEKLPSNGNSIASNSSVYAEALEIQSGENLPRAETAMHGIKTETESAEPTNTRVTVLPEEPTFSYSFTSTILKETPENVARLPVTNVVAELEITNDTVINLGPETNRSMNGSATEVITEPVTMTTPQNVTTTTALPKNVTSEATDVELKQPQNETTVKQQLPGVSKEQQKEADLKAAKSYLGLGKAYLDKGKVTLAIKQFQKVIDKSPEHWEGHYYLGLTYNALAEEDKSISSLKTAASLQDEGTESVDALKSLSNKLVSAKKFEKAIDVLQALSLFSDFSEHQVKISKIYSQYLKNNTAAVSILLDALETEPQSGVILGEVGKFKFSNGDVVGSLAYFEKSIANSSADSDVLVNYGVALNTTGNITAAKEVFMKAYAINPHSPQVNLHLGVMLHYEGNKSKALPFLEKAFRSGETHELIDSIFSSESKQSTVNSQADASSTKQADASSTKPRWLFGKNRAGTNSGTLGAETDTRTIPAYTTSPPQNKAPEKVDTEAFPTQQNTGFKAPGGNEPHEGKSRASVPGVSAGKGSAASLGVRTTGRKPVGF